MIMLFAGFIIALQLDVFKLSTWTIATYPSILIAKSILMDLLNGHVSAALHLGTAYPRLTGNTRAFYDLFQSMIAQTMILSFVITAFALLLGSVFWGTNISQCPEIFFTIAATMGLGLLINLFTERIVFAAFTRGLDLERLIHPLTLVFSGVVITGFYVLVLNLVFNFGSVGRYTIASVALLSVLTAVFGGMSRFKSRYFQRAVREPLPAFVIAAFVSIVTGTVFNRISSFSLMKVELYTVYPALIFIGISVGLLVASTATTKLALGLLKPRFRAIRHHGGQVFAGWLASIIAFVALSGFSIIVNGVLTAGSFGHLLVVLLTANIIALIAIILISYAFAVLIFQKGLDFDNLVIPVENSLGALILTVSLLIAVVVLYSV
jgi:cation transporter-like permease